MAASFEMTVKPSNRNRQIGVLVNELDDRIASIIEWFPYLVAEATLEDIVSLAPRDIPKYPKMLGIRQLTLKGIDNTIGILASGYSYSHRLSAGDERETLLFVKAVRRMNPDTGKNEASKSALLLAKYSPWTMSTLPFEPHRALASIRAIRASEREVKKIEAMRQKDLPQVRKLLEKEGAKLRSPGERIGRRVTRDIGFEVLRREFGIQARHKAHWRPALRMARTSHVDATMKKLVRWLSVPSERRWKQHLVIRQEQASAATRIRRFQAAVAAK